MSTDRLALVALEQKAKNELRYFELCELVYGEPQKRQRLYACLGRHSLFFVHRSLSGLWPDEHAGEIPYEHVIRLVEDRKSVYNFALFLSENCHPQWAAGTLRRIVLMAEHRTRLLMFLKTAWQTDLVWRSHIVKEPPCIVDDIPGVETGEKQLLVKPFKDFQVMMLDGFSFFLRKDFKNAASTQNSSSTATFFDKNRGLTFTVQIQEPRPIETLAADYSDHIRWVAVRQRQTMAAELNGVLIVDNKFYLKKMNLTNDYASWTGWTTFLKSDTRVMVMVFLRRQFIPPLADTAQDIFVTLTCPKHVLDSNQGITEELLLTEARIAADSLSPLAQRCTVHPTFYKDMIQAKLDALLFNEDSMAWLKGSLGLEPEPRLQDNARSFVKSILKILQEESALESPSLLKAIGEDVKTEKDPMLFIDRMVELRCGKPSRGPGGSVNDPVVNTFCTGVARYLAYALDGGFLGPRLALMDLANPWIPTARSQAKIDEVILFFLHIRPKDMSKPFENKPIRMLLHDPALFQENSFNDRVMQSLVELGWVEKAISRHSPARNANNGQGQSGGALPKGQLSLDYAKFLARLLMSQQASINLKASVCRQISAVDASEHFLEICPALLKTGRHTSIYLRTYATLSMINMSADRDSVKDSIVKLNIVPLCIRNLKSSDDDLTRYTLVLLTHLTKNVAILKDMHDEGVTEQLFVLLEKTPAMPSKQALLSELASVIGQMCNSDEIWQTMCNHPAKPVDKLMTLFRGAPQCERLRSKVMFALRMFCDRPTDNQKERQDIAKLVPEIVGDVKAMTKQGFSGPDHLDNAANAILLLGTLFKSLKICQEAIAKNDQVKIDNTDRDPKTMVDVLSDLNFTELAVMDGTRDRLQKLLMRITEVKETNEQLKSMVAPKK